MPLEIRFLKDFGGFWKAKWRQVGIQIASKIDANFERRIIEKPTFSLRKTNILKILEVEVDIKNPSKIGAKIDQFFNASWDRIF